LSAPDNGQGNHTEPARPKSATKGLRCFTGDYNEIANKIQVGKNFFAAISGDVGAGLWCHQNGIAISAVHSEGSNTAGGYLVPDVLSSDIINLVNEYGIIRQYARNRVMTSDTLRVPRRAGGFTAYGVGENSAGTESTKSWDMVTLSTKKLMILARMSNELAGDSVVNLLDDFFFESALAFAEKEDQCGFNGDATSTYLGITGLLPALKAAAGTPTTTSAGGVVVSAGNVWSEFTLPNFCSVVAACPSYARKTAKWYCSPTFFASTMLRLLTAGGGNAVADIADGATRQYFLGYPVVFVETMPTSDSNSQIAALFGALDRAVSFGDRQQITFATSNSAEVSGESVFERDQLAVRAIERLDIVVHDVGSTSAAGPVVGLQSLNS